MTEPTLREMAEQIAERAFTGDTHDMTIDAIEAFGRAVSDAATAAERQRCVAIARLKASVNTAHAEILDDKSVRQYRDLLLDRAHTCSQVAEAIERA